MKNLAKLIKFAPLILLPFLSTIDSKAQRIFTPSEDLPLDSVSKDFQNYQNRKDIDTLAIDTIYDKLEGFPSEILYLDINKDSVFDVMEFYALKGNRFSGFEKTPHPWKYVFLGRPLDEKEDGDVSHGVWYDLSIDGLNGTEINEQVLDNINKERRRKKILDEFLNPKYRELDFYNPERKVDI